MTPLTRSTLRSVWATVVRHVEPLQRERYGNPALDKFLVKIGDWCDVGLRVRWPYASIPPDVVAPARRSARELVPELFETGAR